MVCLDVLDLGLEGLDAVADALFYLIRREFECVEFIELDQIGVDSVLLALREGLFLRVLKDVYVLDALVVDGAVYGIGFVVFGVGGKGERFMRVLFKIGIDVGVVGGDGVGGLLRLALL